MSKYIKGSWEAAGTSVYLPNALGGFDLRDCPHPEDLAERIVDCVNACAGIDSNTLKAGAIVESIKLAKVTAECDELLTVLKKVTNDYRSLRKSYNELAEFDGNPTWDDEGIESESLAVIVKLGGGKQPTVGNTTPIP